MAGRTSDENARVALMLMRMALPLLNIAGKAAAADRLAEALKLAEAPSPDLVDSRLGR